VRGWQSFFLLFSYLLKDPEHAEYRKAVEKYAKNRISILNSEPDWRICEVKLGDQLEALIVSAKEELELIAFLREEKPWEFDPNRKVIIQYQEFENVKE
jgi:hypothetical protein